MGISGTYLLTLGLPCSSDGKETACDTGDPGSIPRLGRSSGEGNGNPLRYSRLENSMDRGAWQVTVCEVAKSWTQLATNITLLNENTQVQNTLHRGRHKDNAPKK